MRRGWLNRSGWIVFPQLELGPFAEVKGPVLPIWLFQFISEDVRVDEISVWHWIIVFLPIIIPVGLKLMGIGAKRVMMKNMSTGQIKTGFYGFSWTYLFFGWFVPLFRGELGVAALHLLFTLVTFGLWQLIVCFLYNRQYTQRLIAAGFRIVDENSVAMIAAEKLGLDLAIHQSAQR